MNQINRKFQAAALPMFLSAALLLSVAALALADYGGRMAAAAVVLVLLGAGVRQGRRWVAYLAFLTTGFGVSAAVFHAMDSHGVVAVLLWSIGLADLLAAVLLFLALWRGR